MFCTKLGNTSGKGFGRFKSKSVCSTDMMTTMQAITVKTAPIHFFMQICIVSTKNSENLTNLIEPMLPCSTHHDTDNDGVVLVR